MVGDFENLELVGHVKMAEDVLAHLEVSRLAFLLVLQAVVLLSLPFKRLRSLIHEASNLGPFWMSSSGDHASQLATEASSTRVSASPPGGGAPQPAIEELVRAPRPVASPLSHAG